MKTAAAFFAFLLFAVPVCAEDIYYAQSTAGGDTGADCANAHALSAITWGAGVGNIGAGDTAHLCGTITSSLSVGASGSAGNPITIKFEDDAKFSAATWNNGSKIITVNGYSYIVIDGGTNGIIEATNNGTALTYQNEFTGVGLTNSTNSEVKNLHIHNLYVHVTEDDLGSGVSGISILREDTSNISVHNNTIHDVRYGIYWAFKTTAGHDGAIYNNTISNIDTGIVVASSDTSSGFANMSIYGNTISDHDIWDSALNLFHHNALHFWNFNTDDESFTGLKVYGNYTYGTWGVHGTAHLFFEGHSSGTMIYNNILTGGLRKIYPNMTGTNIIIANNTMVGDGGGYSLDGVPGLIAVYKNNIEWQTAGWEIGGATIDASNNLTDIDPIFVGGTDFHLQASSLAIDNGANMSAYYALDYDGNTRSGTWDIGAYEYGGVDSTPSAFTFTDQTGVALGSTNNSDNVTVAGIDNQTTLVLTGDASCKYSINGAAWATANDNITVGDNVALQNVASGAYSTAVSCTLNLGGVTDAWYRTTLAAAAAAVPQRFRGGSMGGRK